MSTGSEKNTAAEPVFRDTATTYHTEQGIARCSNRDCASYKLMSGVDEGSYRYTSCEVSVLPALLRFLLRIGPGLDCSIHHSVAADYRCCTDDNVSSS